MAKFLTKHALYNLVDNLKVRLDLAPTEYPLNSLELAYKYCINLEVQFIEFEKLCGILYKKPTMTTMALNKLHTPGSQNFDCMHELIHYFLHTKQSSFNCIDFDGLRQDDYIEWQANEGAAQALVPYQEFIPLYVNLFTQNKSDPYLFKTIDLLATHFQVSDHVIFNRISSLRYEIYQYFTLHTPLDKIKIISYSKQQKNNLHHLKAEKKYCSRCFSIVYSEDLFCRICGQKLNLLNNWEGLGYMKYDYINIDPETSKAFVCPICGNEETSIGDYCPICGQYLVNRCTGTYILHDDNYGDKEFNCDTLQDGNARFCVRCGSETTFYRDGLLKDWRSARQKILADQGIIEEMPVFDDNDLPF